MKSLLTLALCLFATLGLHAQFKGSVPRMNINIEGNKIVTDKETWLKATVSLEGNGYCENFKQDSVTIRGRGNSSWTVPTYNNPNPKNPYRLKFDKKKSIAGLKKGKNWVLLANKQSRSHLANAYGMAIARMVGTLAANDMVPVELYINGEYRGSYNLTEKVGISANSIDIEDEDKAVLLELDTYYDEEYKFHDVNYPRLPVMVKDPDLGGKKVKITLAQIEDSIASLTADIKAQRDISGKMDTAMLAKYMLVNFLICNQELLHPKSTYLFREKLDDPMSKWQFGPVWDLDWAYGYEENSNYGTFDYTIDFLNYKRMENNQFWRDLLAIPSVKTAYAREWSKFMNDGLDSLLTYCKEYYDFVKPSLQNDCRKWGQTFDYDRVYNNMTTWLTNRANYMYADIAATSGITAVNTNNTDNMKATDNGVYNLAGQKVADRLSPSLPHGIYIVNGKKIVI